MLWKNLFLALGTIKLWVVGTHTEMMQTFVGIIPNAPKMIEQAEIELNL